MSRRHEHLDGRVAEADGGAVLDHHVAPRRAPPLGDVEFQLGFRHVPVGAAHHHLRAVALLEPGGAPIVVAMAVGDDDALHLRWIEVEPAQPALDQALGLVLVVERVKQDDAVAGGERPGADPLGADEGEVVEGPGGRRRRLRHQRLDGGRRRGGGHGGLAEGEPRAEVFAGGGAGGGQMARDLW